MYTLLVVSDADLWDPVLYTQPGKEKKPQKLATTTDCYRKAQQCMYVLRLTLTLGQYRQDVEQQNRFTRALLSQDATGPCHGGGAESKKMSSAQSQLISLTSLRVPRCGVFVVVDAVLIQLLLLIRLPSDN